MSIEIYPPEAYSPVEQQKIAQFRTKVSDLKLTSEQTQDSQLIRWLRARNLSIAKAYEMLKKSLQWRKDNNVDKILEREAVPLEILQKMPYARVGYDKEGYPIFICPAGHNNLLELLEQHGIETAYRLNIMFCENMMKMLHEASEEQGRPVTQMVEIIDLEGFSLRQYISKMGRDFMAKTQTDMDNNYPEILRYAIVINTPKAFYILYNLIKPFIAKRTLEKLDIYGPDVEKWKKAIAQRFPSELIPPHWGGTLKGSDEFCSQSDIWIPGPVSLSFFGQKPSDDDLGFTPVTINARDSFKVNLPVKIQGSSLVWRFRSQDYDIGFQIVFENGNVILPFKRINSHKEIHEDSHVCENLGTYTVIFDNSYSYTTAKSVSYNVSLIEPVENSN